MATAGDIIKGAARLLGVVASENDLTAAEYADGLTALNQMLAVWEADGLLSVSTASVSHALTSGVGSYTIGSGATIDTTRPLSVDGAYVRYNGVDSTLWVIGRSDYDALSDKDLTGVPNRIFYDADYATATLYLYPVPDAAYTLYLNVETPLPQFAATSDTVTLPNEYLAPLRYNLAVDMAPEFGVEPSGAVAARAEGYTGWLRRLNSQPVTRMRLPFNRDSFDITRGY